MKSTLIALSAAVLLAGCSSTKHADEGDRKFESRDFDGAAAAYAKAAEKDPGDAELATKLESARKNAATAHAERAAKAAEEGDLNRAIEEIKRSREYDAANASYEADLKKYETLRKDIAAKLEEARKADAERAHEILSGLARYQATFPEIGTRLAGARDSYVKRLLAAAEDFGKAGQWMKSEALLDHAAQISAGSPALSADVKATKTNLRVMELMDQGWALKSRDDLEGALNRFQTAVELRPDAGDAVAALEETKRVLAVKYAGRAGEAKDAGDALQAYAWLARAEAMDGEATEEIATRVRSDAAALLVTKAFEASKKNLGGLEWLRLQQAKAVKPGDAEIDRKLRDAGARLERAMRPVVLVKEFRNGTKREGREIGLCADAYRLLQQLAMNGRLATILDEDAYQIHLKENKEFTPDIIVKATLERFDLIHHPDRREAKAKEYDKRVTFLDYTGKNYVEGTEKRTFNYVVVHRRVTGVGLLSYEIYDVGARAPMNGDTVRGDLEKADDEVAGHAEAGVPDDPDEIPADDELLNQLQTQLRDRLGEKLRAELGWFGKRYYTAYQRAKDDGDMDKAVSNAVVAIRSLRAADRPVLAEDVEFVAKRTGWSMKDEKIVLESLR